MNVQRLRDVAEVLRTVPEARFDMGVWQSSTCGTVACAVGHYCLARPQSGLELVDGLPYEPATNMGEWNAVRSHFDLTLTQACHLFDANAYLDNDLIVDPDYYGPKPAEVIARIEAFVASGGVVPEEGEVPA